MRICEIDKLLSEKMQLIVAIDGKCSAGKTTFAALLRDVYDCNVISMDHFFLPLHLRSEERLCTPGGNVHYERFTDEVLSPLLKNISFSYRAFNCKTMEYDKKGIHIPQKRMTVIEGSYSMHPKFGDPYDLKIFLDIDKAAQRERIIKRNGEPGYEVFEKKWIPMECAYFEAFDIKNRCDFVYNNAI